MSVDYTFLPRNPLRRDGTSRDERLLPALNPKDPAFVKVDERSRMDIIDFARAFAKLVRYYDFNNFSDGDWRAFFDMDFNDLLDSVRNSSLKPHLALFAAFIKLFRYAQRDINTITQRHLDFYYQQILQLPANAAVADKVNLVFELARNVSTYLLPAGTLLSAGKDETGKELLYSTDIDIVLNKATVESIKTVFVDVDKDYKIYAAAVANSADGLGKKLPATDPTWNTFGESQQDKGPDSFTMQEAHTGIAVASPLLLLNEGNRTITITFRFIFTNSVINFDLHNPFSAYLSGEKGWLGPYTPVAKLSVEVVDATTKYYKLAVILNLPQAVPAVTAYNELVIKEGYQTSFPLIKLLLNNNASDYSYKVLSQLQLVSTTVAVAVTGFSALIVESDQSVLNPQKPFQPFGAVPVIGSSFAIGAPEFDSKAMDTMAVNITWMDKPPHMDNYYALYQDVPAIPINYTSFKAKLSYRNDQKWRMKTVNLFQFDALDTTHIDIVKNNADAISTELIPDRFMAKLELSSPVRPLYQVQAFGHKEYPSLYANTAILKAKRAPTDPNPDFPNQPYTPVIKSMSVDYTASGAYAGFDAFGEDAGFGAQYFYVEPFGQRPVVSATESGAVYFLPQYQEEGNLYLGIKSLVPPQTLSLFFQVAEGTGDNSLAFNSENVTIQWSYLRRNKWVLLDNLKILGDTTNKFQMAGIISFDIPGDADNNASILIAGLYWLKAAIVANAGVVSKLIAVNAQAVAATFVDNGNSLEHLVYGLPGNTIKKFVSKHAEIKSVQQPYPSFGGQPAEQSSEYYIRVSERVKHKNRAVQIWDYERMVLEQFPSVYKVKCINHTNDSSEIAPGSITLIIISNLRNKNAPDPLQPRTGVNTLTDIRQFISGCVSPFVDIHVENPLYEQVLVDFKVGFHIGLDAGYYGKLLNEDIKKFLSPWAYEEGHDIIFENQIHKSVILAFIEQRPYVDFVNNFCMYHIFEGYENNGIGKMAIDVDFIIAKPVYPAIGDMTIAVDFIVGADVETAAAKTARSILVSAPEHRITVLESGQYVCSGMDAFGIGMMAVDVDFIVSET
ncbi:baseplate J/gp47 family protein [Chitinophaga sp. MM2321]|uniref:baseplate J/gp47 family protein n=1 Tax=Chitinophaga sp. MM2321 TaxID=3137178 RepID=UPI0032D58FD8